jgi:ABC-2 type transport system ATP-binding protein
MTRAASVSVSWTGRGASGGHATWDVLIDENVVGSVAQGQAVELPIEPGPHTVRVRSNRYLRSAARPFEAAAGRTVFFSGRPRARHPFIVQRSIFWLLVSLVKHDVWIELAMDQGDAGENALPTVTRQPTDNELDGAVGQPSARPAPRPPARAVTAGPPLDGRTENLALVVNQLTKRFGARTAFSEVTFAVAHGEVFGFLGPNGAGKTTTVRTLATLIAPTSGSATVAGIPLCPENEVEIRQRISVMPEAPGLYLRLTVTENLEYFAGLYGLRQIGPRIKDALEAVNLADRAGDLCGGLSKGLRQRVGLARTLLSDPAIMFLDEPTSGLDPVAAREVHDLINGLREKGVTIFLTTHRLDEAERLCDRVAILNTTLRTVGRPAELREQLFKSALVVRTLAPVSDPGQLFGALGPVEEWRSDEPGSYVLAVSDPLVAAPQVTRALVSAGADVLSIGEAQHSLEDVYLELIAEDVEAQRQ